MIRDIFYRCWCDMVRVSRPLKSVFAMMGSHKDDRKEEDNFNDAKTLHMSHNVTGVYKF